MDDREQVSTETNLGRAVYEKISVVVPVYNRADVLLDAIYSVLTQSAPPFEIIVVNDGSTDETSRLIFPPSQTSIRVINLEHNGGAAFARNAGVAVANGDWIAFLDADDLWQPDKLRLQLTLTSAGVDAIATNVLVRRPGCQDFLANCRPPTFDKNLADDLMISDLTVQTSSLLIRRAWMLKHQFDIELTRHQDWDLVLRLTEAGCRWGYLNKALSIYRIDGDPRRISNSKYAVAGTILWFRKRADLVESGAAAYYFSFRCFPAALRQSVPRALKQWFWLSTVSYSSFFRSVRGLCRLFWERTHHRSG